MGMRSGKALKVEKVRARGSKRTPARAKSRAVTRTVAVDKNAALRALAQRIVDVTVSNDEAGMMGLYADAIESKEANNPPSVGIHAIRDKFAMWRGMASDAVFRPRSVLADGQTIVIEWEGRVTLAATGRIVDFNETAVHEIANGKIVRERFYYDPAVLQS
jgi:ketosteroid isomerase-like protein